MRVAPVVTVLLAATAVSFAEPPAAVLDASQAFESPAPAGSFAPQLARTADGSVLLSWLEAAEGKQHRFRVARLRGGSWEAPVTVSEGVQFFANWADVPSVSEQAGVMFAHWLEKSGPGTYAYDVKVRTSTDNGKSWGSPWVAHADRSQTEHGFASFFTRPDKKPGAVWLDGRETGGAGHDGHGKGAMTLRAAARGPEGHDIRGAPRRPCLRLLPNCSDLHTRRRRCRLSRPVAVRDSRHRNRSLCRRQMVSAGDHEG